MINRLSSIRLAGVIALALVATPVWADDDDVKAASELDLVKLLNVKVSTATKTSEDVDDAPAVIRVITREEIFRWGYRSVGEALDQCLGFFSVDDHVLPNVAVRGVTGGLGAESSVIKVMIDGRSVAYRTTSGNWLGVELVSLETIKQIEIIRGPASALYGADAFLGVVNIITMPPEEGRPFRGRVSFGAAGENPSGQYDAATSHTVGRFDFMFASAGEYGSRTGLMLPSESPAPTLPSYVGTRRRANNLDRRSLVLQGRVGYRVPDVGQLVVSAFGSGLSRGGDFGSAAQLTNGVDGQGRTRGTVVAREQTRVDIDGLLHTAKWLDLSAQASLFRGGVLPSDRIEIGSDLSYVRRETAYRGIDSRFEARFFPSNRFNAIVGMEAVYDHERFSAPQHYSVDSDAPLLSQGGGRTVDLTNLGAFVSSNVNVIDRWLKLTGGLRYDHHSQYGDQLTGRAGLTSHLTSTVVAKLLYGSAFKAPSPFLLYAAPLRPGDVEGNARLNPQYIDTVEAELVYRPSRLFSVSSGVSQSWLSDVAQFTPQGINLTARNVAKQQAIAWETRADLSHGSDYAAYLSTELVHSTRDLGQEGYAATLVGSTNVVYPPYIVRGGVSFELPRFDDAVPLETGVQGSFIGPRRAADASIVEHGGAFTMSPYLRLDAFIATRDLYLIPGHESKIALRGRNLLGSVGPIAGFSGFEYPLAPREIFLELSHTY